MTWLETDDVLAEAGHPDYAKLGFETQSELNTHVTDNVIPAVQNLIETYLGTTYADSAVPAGVRSVALRAAAQALVKISIRKMGALIRAGDYQVEVSKSDILTPELRAELDLYKQSGSSTRSRTRSTSYMTKEIKSTWDET